MSELQIQRRILGVDFGRARIGLAISDELGLLAHPLETIAADADAAKRVAEIARERNVARIVVGLPRHMSGDVGTSAEDALAFAAKLRELAGCEVVTEDERLTTIAANRALRESGQRTRDSRKYVDQVAAQMILQNHLDRLQARGELAEWPRG